MTTLEMRKYLGQIKMDYMLGKTSKQDTLNILQNVDWNTIEETGNCATSSLQTFVDNTVNFINSRT